MIGLLLGSEDDEYDELDEETKSISVAKLSRLLGRKMPSLPRLKELFNRSDDVTGLLDL